MSADDWTKTGTGPLAPVKTGGAEAPHSAAVAQDATLARSSEDRFYYATQWQLMWWRFRRHKVAFISLWLLLAFYLVAIFCEFVSPYDPNGRFSKFTRAAPSQVRATRQGEGLQWPFVYAVTGKVVDYRLTVTEVEDVKYPIRFFVHGWKYKLFGLVETDLHLFGVEEPAALWLFGLDMLGRDVFSRAIYGSRISLFVGLIGLAFTFVVGMLMGGLSGYFGGFVDGVIQRIIDFMNSIPMLPVLMVLAGAIPRTIPSVQLFFLTRLLCFRFAAFARFTSPGLSDIMAFSFVAHLLLATSR